MYNNNKAKYLPKKILFIDHGVNTLIYLNNFLNKIYVKPKGI